MFASGEAPSGLPLERLEAEICQQAAHLDAGTCRLLLLVAEYDRRQGWAAWGCRSAAHWMSWHAGVGLGAAREQVRVGRALQGLPLVREAFSRGELSYSKVRAITRVATPAIEDELVRMGRESTASQLETVVRGYRGAVLEDSGARVQHETRYLRCDVDDDGSVVIRARLAPEEGEVVMRALDAARDAVHEIQRSDRATDEGSTSIEAPLEHSTDLSEVHGRPEDASETSSDENGPELCVETVDDPHGAAGADALAAIAESYLCTGPTGASGGERVHVVLHVDAERLSGRPTGQAFLAHAGGVAPETARRLACDASVVTMLVGRGGEPLSVGRRTRTIPPAIRRALWVRDEHCRFPGCAQRRYVDGHHIVHWARGGETSLANLILLCRFHHRVVHDAGYGIERDPDGSFLFRRPDAWVLERSAGPPTGDPREIERMNRADGLGIDHTTSVAPFDGTAPVYGWAIDGLLARATPSAESVVAS